MYVYNCHTKTNKPVLTAKINVADYIPNNIREMAGECPASVCYNEYVVQML